MYSQQQLAEYMDEIRKDVCSRCIERPPGGPPCAPLGKRCGIELNLPQLIDAVHARYSGQMEPYIANFHEMVCTHCPNRPTNQCPCPLEYLLSLAVEAIEAVDERRLAANSSLAPAATADGDTQRTWARTSPSSRRSAETARQLAR